MASKRNEEGKVVGIEGRRKRMVGEREIIGRGKENLNKEGEKVGTYLKKVAEDEKIREIKDQCRI